MNLTNEASATVLQKLIEEDIITEDEVTRIASKFPSETMQLCVDTIHSLLCSSDSCTYNQEEDTAHADNGNPWIESDHRHWLGFVQDFIDRTVNVSEATLGLAIEGYKNIFRSYEDNKESGGASLFDLWRDGV